MSGLPTEMIDRWQDRAEAAHGDGLIYWHMLVGDIHEVVPLVQEARARLAGFSEFHMTPLKWLHMTTLIVGARDEISEMEISRMAGAASRMLADVPPLTVTLGKILYHPEAIMLAAQPREALLPVREAARRATQEVTGSPGRSGTKLATWTPHITIAYSTARQPAAPIISALGSSLPERKVRIGEISLINQRGPERLWDWHTQATIKFGGRQA